MYAGGPGGVLKLHRNIRLVILCGDGHIWEERTKTGKENENKMYILDHLFTFFCTGTG